MRRLETKEEIEKRKKTKLRIISFILLLIMGLSTLGYAFSSFSGSGDENQNENQDAEGRISFKYQDNEITLLSSKDEIKNISVNISMLPEIYSGKILYIDSKNQGVTQEIASSIGKFSSRAQMACYGKCEENLPEKNCTDNLIVWRESGESKVTQEGNCVFIEGDMRAADAFIYTLFNPAN